MKNKVVRQMLTSINPYVGYTIGLLARAKDTTLFEVPSDVNPEKIYGRTFGRIYTKLSLTESIIISKRAAGVRPYKQGVDLVVKKRALKMRPQPFNEEELVTANMAMLEKDKALERVIESITHFCKNALKQAKGF